MPGRPDVPTATSAGAGLVHVHDPMCSWCWAFRPTLERIVAALPPDVAFSQLLGGLAPDTDEPMPEATRERLQATWRRIERAVPGTRFEHAFWTRNVPRRSTFRACRAVIAAREQARDLEEAMIRAIQHAYYLEARNPAEREVLIELAVALGCDETRFAEALDSARLVAALGEERAFAARLGATGFPSLFLLESEGGGTLHAHPLPLDHNDPAPTLARIATLRAA